MEKMAWDEWIAEHGRQVVEYVMVCLEDAKELWDRATKAEKERDEAQKKLGFATARIAELEAAQAKPTPVALLEDVLEMCKEHLPGSLKRELLEAVKRNATSAKPTLEITDEMVEAAAEEMRRQLIGPVVPLWKETDPATRRYWIRQARAAMEAVKDRLVGACPECPEGDEELREKVSEVIRSRVYWALGYGPRPRGDEDAYNLARYDESVDDILSLVGPRLTPEIQERLDYLEREHAKFCEIFNDYAEEEVTEYFQTRLANGDAAIAVLREYRDEMRKVSADIPLRRLDAHLSYRGILDLITGEPDGSCSDCPDNCPSSCSTCSDTAICPQAPVNPVERVPLPEKVTRNDTFANLKETINTIIDYLADRERADA